MAAPNEKKLKEMVVHICRVSEDDPNFGKVKLTKLLAYADFAAYAQLGASISGSEYMKLDFGPVPTALPPVLEILAARGEVIQTSTDSYGWSQHRYSASRDADTAALTDSEWKIVNAVVSHFRDYNSTDIMLQSHRDFVGWQLADERHTIPYETAFLADPKTQLSGEEIRRGQEIAADLALAV